MIYIFTDGASRGNPGPGGWGSVLVVENEAEKRVIELGGREERTTNNRMELSAVIESLVYLHKNLSSYTSPLTIYSDSSYVVNGITKWVAGWMRNNWQTKAKQDVANKDLWQKLVEVSEPFAITWQLLPGHAGVAGNERADDIATACADERNPKLFAGPLEEYSLTSKELLNTQSNGSKRASSGKAYSYLSLVEGEAVRHGEWESCKRRVAGKARVKYRKTLSKEHEEEILSEWGVAANEVRDEK